MPEKIGDWLTRPEIEEKRRVIEDLIITGRGDNKNRDHYRDALKDKIRAGLMDKKFYLELLTKFKVPFSNKTLQKIWGNIEIMANVLIPKITTENEEDEMVVTDETITEDEEKEKWTTPQNILEIDDVLLPTEKGEKGIQPGTGDYIPPRLYPRARLLHQLLKNNGLTENDYLVIKGNNKYIKKYGEQREMIRQTS